ncbi:MAG: glycosyltransferase family 39 protein, partial [Candidatus Omnitrophota bacterium]
FLLVSFYFIRKYFSGGFAALFIILLAFSPLNMAMARRALTESMYCLFSVLSLWLFLDYIKEDSNLKRILFVLVFTFTILIKETAALLCIFFTIFLVFRKFFQKKEVKLKDFLFCSFLPLAIVFILYASLGGLTNTINIMAMIIRSSTSNLYAITYGSGPWYRYLIDYLIISPPVTLLGTGFIFHYLCLRREKASDVIDYFLLFFIFILVAFSFFHKNIRYVINLDIVFRIFSLLILTEISKQVSKNKYGILLAGLVIAIALWDITNFSRLFLVHGIYDPVTLKLLRAEQIIL